MSDEVKAAALAIAEACDRERGRPAEYQGGIVNACVKYGPTLAYHYLSTNRADDGDAPPPAPPAGCEVAFPGPKVIDRFTVANAESVATLQAENAKLKAELEGAQRIIETYRTHACVVMVDSSLESSLAAECAMREKLVGALERIRDWPENSSAGCVAIAAAALAEAKGEA